MVDDGSNSQRPGVATEKGDSAAVQDPHGSLHVVQRPLQVGGLMRDPVKLEVQQGDSCRDACGAEVRRGRSFCLHFTLRFIFDFGCFSAAAQFYLTHFPTFRWQHSYCRLAATNS